MGGGPIKLPSLRDVVKYGVMPAWGASEGAIKLGISGVKEIAKEFTPEAPKMEDPPALATKDTAQPAMTEAEAEQRRARGRASTILTGGRGLTGPATTARRTLLGI